MLIKIQETGQMVEGLLMPFTYSSLFLTLILCSCFFFRLGPRIFRRRARIESYFVQVYANGTCIEAELEECI